jgi:hypothetical protein
MLRTTGKDVRTPLIMGHRNVLRTTGKKWVSQMSLNVLIISLNVLKILSQHIQRRTQPAADEDPITAHSGL